MSNQEIVDGNLLIAKFMGVEMNDYGQWEFKTQPTSYYREDSKHIIFHYHEDWNWLMGVFEKIGSMRFEWEILYYLETHPENWVYKACFLKNGDVTVRPTGKTSIESSWLAAIEFINWHNQYQLEIK